MIKPLSLIELLFVIIIIASPSLAGSDNKPMPNQANNWNGVWQDVKSDWKEVGNNIKETGANIGHAFKNEFRKMPENVRQGYKAAKNDFKSFTSSDRVNPTEK